jgi:hypothetical protein
MLEAKEAASESLSRAEAARRSPSSSAPSVSLLKL